MEVTRTFAFAAGVIASTGAFAQSTWYTNSFESGTRGPEWSANTVINTEARPYFTRFNGRYSGGYTELTLSGLPTFLAPPPNGGGGGGGGSGDDPGDGGSGGDNGGGTGSANWYRVALSFDFYCIDSWDGSVGYGPDTFTLTANEISLMSYTFSNQPGCWQTAPYSPVSSGEWAFNPRWIDAIYRNITAEFDYAGGEDLVIRWADGGLQGLGDESWGIDNISITYNVVPAPSVAATAMILGSILNRRRRR